MILCPYKKKTTTKQRYSDETVATEEFCACESNCMAYVDNNGEPLCALMFRLNADVGKIELN